VIEFLAGAACLGVVVTIGLAIAYKAWRVREGWW